MPSAFPPPPPGGVRGALGARLLQAGARAAADLARLVVPVACPGCGEVDVPWCEECAAVWWQVPLRSETAAPRLDLVGAPSLPVWAIASLDGPAHGTVVAWKDAGRRDLDALLGDAMRRAARHVAASLPPAQWAVVPVPSRRASAARRGVDLPLLLARAAARGLAEAGVEACVIAVLTPTARDQRGQGAAARWRQAAGIGVRDGLARARGSTGERGPVLALLVDDVVTTGASLAAAAKALEVTFLTACAGLALASAPGASALPDSGIR